MKYSRVYFNSYFQQLRPGIARALLVFAAAGRLKAALYRALPRARPSAVDLRGSVASCPALLGESVAQAACDP